MRGGERVQNKWDVARTQNEPAVQQDAQADQKARLPPPQRTPDKEVRTGRERDQAEINRVPFGIEEVIGRQDNGHGQLPGAPREPVSEEDQRQEDEVFRGRELHAEAVSI